MSEFFIELIPHPGSSEALARSCRCPVIDNHYGRGIETTMGTIWWMSADCPLHGWDETDEEGVDAR